MKVNFKTRARTVNLLGKDNILDHNSAVIELVKNSYDAHASKCFVSIREESIIIADNGSGMSFQVINDVFFTLGTDNKLNSWKNDINGSMGIGRLSLGSLGETTKIITSNGLECHQFEIDWEVFNQPVNLEEIDFEITKFSIEDFQVYAEKYLEESFKRGTIIEIKKLRNTWSKEESKNLDILRQRLSSIKSPFIENDFTIITDFFDDDEIISNNIINDHDAKLLIDYRKKSKSLELKIEFNEINLSNLNSEFIEYIIRNKKSSIEYILDNKGKLKNKYEYTFLLNQKELNLEISNLNKSFEHEESSTKINKILENIGDFVGEINFIRRSPVSITSPVFLTDNKISKIERDSFTPGIFLYRDAFRVRPYGEQGNNGFDWIGIENIRSKNPAGVNRKDYLMQANQLTGALQFSRIENKIFEDQANREGIKNTEEFIIFKKILLIAIKKMSLLRHFIFKDYSDYEKNKITGFSKNVDLSIYKKMDSFARKNNMEVDKLLIYSQLKKEINIKNLVNLYIKARVSEDLLNQYQDEVDLLQALSTQAISISYFAHQIKNHELFFKKYNNNLKEIETYLSENYNINYKKLKPKHNLTDFRNNSYSKIKDIYKFLYVSLGNPKRETNKKYFVHMYLTNLFNEWSTLLNGDKTYTYSLDVHYNGIDESLLNKIYANLTQLDSIFINLITNSLKAFKVTRQLERKISVNFIQEGNAISIIYKDNGPGLDWSNNDIHKNKDIIFSPFFTTYDKKHNTGLGLWIVQSTCQKIKWNLELLIEEEGFGLKINI